MISADEIGTTVTTYLVRHPDETDRLAALTQALAQPDDLTCRSRFDGHVTCSAVITNREGRVLHIRHNALGVWLRPGGHLETDDTSLVGAALREVAEETGIQPHVLRLVDQIPIDIDTHPIPANPARGEPAHQHFDLRYAFELTATADITLQTEEVADFAWLRAGSPVSVRMPRRR